MFVLCALWGGNQVVIKLTNAGISPVLQAGLRSAGAALLVWAWSARRGVRLFQSDGTLAPGLLAGALFAAEFALLYWALEFTAASRAVIFLYTAPFVVALGGQWFVPGERLSALQAAGLVAAFAGVVAAFADRLAVPAKHELIGDAMALAAGILWGATTVVVKASRLVRVSANKTLFYQLAVSAAALPPVSLALGERGVFDPTALVLGLLLFQTAVVAFASYLAWFWLVKHYPAGRLAAFTFLTPPFGVLAGGALLGERVTLLHGLALALVAGGIYLVNRPAAAPAR